VPAFRQGGVGGGQPAPLPTPIIAGSATESNSKMFNTVYIEGTKFISSLYARTLIKDSLRWPYLIIFNVAFFYLGQLETAVA